MVIAGCEAHVCLMQTALDLLEDEFEVWVVTDACASRTDRDRDAAFDRLAGAGAEQQGGADIRQAHLSSSNAISPSAVTEKARDTVTAATGRGA